MWSERCNSGGSCCFDGLWDMQEYIPPGGTSTTAETGEQQHTSFAQLLSHMLCICTIQTPSWSVTTITSLAALQLSSPAEMNVCCFPSFSVLSCCYNLSSCSCCNQQQLFTSLNGLLVSLCSV